MKKHFLFSFLTVLSLAVCASDGIVVRGGKLTPAGQNNVLTGVRHLNFVHAERISENAIYLTHSVGIHSVDEKTVGKASLDNGKTWQPTPMFFGFATITNADGKSVTVLRGRNDESSKKFTIISTRYDAGTLQKLESATSVFELPFAFRGKLHRDIRRAPDGTLRSTFYGLAEGKKGCFTALIDSKDDGKSWNFVSIVDDGSEGDRDEGACEPCVETAKDGTVIVMMRSGSNGKPLYQRTSTDGGKTWGELVKVTDGGSVAPSLLRLQDGTLVAVTGRPGVYLLTDFSGSGKQWDKVPVYSGAGSSYSSIVENAPGELMVLYDISDFGSLRNPDTFNRVVVSTYKIEKGDFAAAEIKDGYQTMYKAETGKTPEALGLTKSLNYWHAPKGDRPYHQMVEIPERPHPVFRLSSRSKVVSYSNRPWHKLLNIPSGMHKAKIGFELRINDNDIKEAQFLMMVMLNDAGGKTYSSVLQLAAGKVTLSAPKGVRTAAIPVRTGEFHTYEFLLDADADKAEVLIDGKSVLSGKMVPYPGKGQSGMSFGDMSNAVFGTVDLSWLGWSFSL